MPGELGNEEEQLGAGYYEHRYKQDPDPNDPSEEVFDERANRISKRRILNVLKKFNGD